MALGSMTFQDLRTLLDARRDFSSLRQVALGKISQRVGTDAKPVRLVFMLTDDYDLFNLDQEVVYDSSFDSGNSSSIFDEIL